MTSLQEQKPSRSSQGEVSRRETRKPYAKPEIIHELELEARAGSPLVAPPWADFPGLDIPGMEGP